VLHSIDVSRACGLAGAGGASTGGGGGGGGGGSSSDAPGSSNSSPGSPGVGTNGGVDTGDGGDAAAAAAAAAAAKTVGGWPLRMALDPNGHGLVLSSRTAAAALVCLEPGGSGGTVHAIPGHSRPVTCVDWHPTKSVALTGSADNSMQVTHLSMRKPPSH
jgi:hypothetical protein